MLGVVFPTRAAPLALGYSPVAGRISAPFEFLRSKIQRALFAGALPIVIAPGATFTQIFFATAHLASALCSGRRPSGGVWRSILAGTMAISVTCHAQSIVHTVDLSAALGVCTLARLTLLCRLAMDHALRAMIPPMLVTRVAAATP